MPRPAEDNLALLLWPPLVPASVLVTRWLRMQTAQGDIRAVYDAEPNGGRIRGTPHFAWVPQCVSAQRGLFSEDQWTGEKPVNSSVPTPRHGVPGRVFIRLCKREGL